MGVLHRFQAMRKGHDMIFNIYQIKLTRDEIEAVNSGAMLGKWKAKAAMMFGADEWKQGFHKHYTHAGVIEADFLEDAFDYANMGHPNAKMRTRSHSASVGDIFEIEDKFYICDNEGFVFLPLFADEAAELEATNV